MPKSEEKGKITTKPTPTLRGICVFVYVSVRICVHMFPHSSASIYLAQKMLPFFHFFFAWGSPFIHLPGGPEKQETNKTKNKKHKIRRN